MRNEAMKKELNTAIANDDKKTIIKILNPLINMMVEQMLAGILVRNIKAGLTNKGIGEKCSEMLVEIAQVRYENNFK